jgi:hypothetical protein
MMGDGARKEGAMTGAVSATLEAEVRGRIVRHGIVVWLDKEGHYTAFVDALKKQHEDGAFPYPVLGYRGSFLELMIALERFGSGLDREPLLIHLPGYGHAASVRETPLLELYDAGHHFSKNISTLVSEAAAGRVTPDDLKSFLAAPGLSLAGADAWLDRQLSGATPGVAQRLEALDIAHILDGLLGSDRFLERDIPEAGVGDLAGHLHRHTGMDAAWLEFYLSRSTGLKVREVAEAFAGYLLCVEYVFDLKRPPVTRALQSLAALPKPHKERCLALVQRFREHHPDAYEYAADEAEGHVSADARDATAEDLGKIDTFRFEEQKVREEAIRAALSARWQKALDWAKQRAGVAFWLDREQKLRWAWTLVEHAAGVGVAVERAGAGLPDVRSLAEAVEHYTQKAWIVDAAHRAFEQNVHGKLSPMLPNHNDLLEVIASARRTYRAWADELARSFSRVCRAYGALPDDSIRQRNIFDRIVHPIVRDGEKVVVFLIDAFRYEMAIELEAQLKGPGVTMDRRAFLAELPTITEVGMNALAPVVSGDRLTPVLAGGGFGGFRWSEFTVRDPETRARAMGVRSVGKAAPLFKLAEVLTMPLPELQKKMKSAPNVIVVHSLELDDAGEKGFGPATFEGTLKQIREAWHHLSQAGIKHFVLTGDHGFLLQDRTVAEHVYGKPTDPSRRFVLDDQARAEAGMLAVPLSSLKYDVPEEKYLLFREDTAVWKTTKPGAPFVHGGNSLQERVIPVLVVRRQRDRGGSDTAYEVELEALDDILGRRRLKLKLRLAPYATGALAFTGAGHVTLGLRVKNRADLDLTIVDVEGAAKLVGGLLRVPVEGDWATVYFQIEGEIEERVQVEVFHPDGVEKIEPRTAEGWFTVTGRSRRPPSVPPPPLDKPEPGAIAPGIEDEGFRRVFEHIDRYGTVNELELAQILGGSRRVRAFSRQFDELVSKFVRFKVRIDTTGAMKCYVKEAG